MAERDVAERIGRRINRRRKKGKKLKSNLTVSVVIPVLDDLDALATTLEEFRSARIGPDEIIIIDGGHDSDCASLALRYHCIYLRTRPVRGYQLHAGARCASGDVIWFLHADAHPPVSAIALIRDQIAAGAIGGYFRFRFAGQQTWYKRLLTWFINIRTRFGVPYGDQGLFIRTSSYATTGGFPDFPLFEEVSLVKAARSDGRFVEIDTPIGVSPRRWEQDGWLRRTLANRLLALGYMLGISPQTLARRYRTKC
jgi:rSAM/selenodomain-associated transferase 2